MLSDDKHETFWKPNNQNGCINAASGMPNKSSNDKHAAFWMPNKHIAGIHVASGMKICS